MLQGRARRYILLLWMLLNFKYNKMGKIFLNQTKLRIQLNLIDDDGDPVDITGYNEILIKYKKRNGADGSFTASCDDPTTGVIYYDVQDGDIDQIGVWTFWGYVTFSDDTVAPSESIRVIVYPEGE